MSALESLQCVDCVTGKVHIGKVVKLSICHVLGQTK